MMNSHRCLSLASSFRTVALFVVAAWIVPAPAWAAKFANQFVEFELPPQWACNLEGAEWVCQNTNEAKKREAVIILAAKLRGEQDTLDQYQAFLKNPKTYTSVQNKSVTSEVKYAKLADVNSQSWVDALHLDSEIPGFYTRYLATIKMDIGVLVTYSINSAKYQDYLQDFETMVRTLRVFRKGTGINSGPQGNLFDIKIPQGMSEGTVFPPAPTEEAGAKRPKQKSDDDLMLYGAIAVAAVAFLIWRRRRR